MAPESEAFEGRALGAKHRWKRWVLGERSPGAQLQELQELQCPGDSASPYRIEFLLTMMFMYKMIVNKHGLILLP